MEQPLKKFIKRILRIQMKLTPFIIAVTLGLGFISCKKKGCTDPTATNFSAEAEKDDESCTYDEVDPLANEKQQVKENEII